MSRPWPDKDDLLALTRESQEHQRAWGLVRGLARSELERRRSASRDPQKIDEQVAKIRDLEAKVISQKARLRELEEVIRPYELETERLLVNGIRAVLALPHVLATSDKDRKGHKVPAEAFVEMGHALQELLDENSRRKGPRPTGNTVNGNSAAFSMQVAESDPSYFSTVITQTIADELNK